MRRWIALLLLLALLGSSCCAATKFKPTTAAEGKQQALSLLRTTAFSTEYGSGAQGHPLWRWEDPIRIYVAGKPTTADLKELDAFLMDLSFRVPGLPPITRVKQQAGANLVMTFTTLKKMGEAVADYEAGNWGFFTFWTDDHIIYRAEIAIACDKATQNARYHLIREELVGALGLGNDHETYSDSILYQQWTTTRELSAVDWLMLNYLYSPVVYPGMDADAAIRALQVYIGQ